MIFYVIFNGAINDIFILIAINEESINNNGELGSDINFASYHIPDFSSEGDINAINRRYPSSSFYDYSGYDNPVPFSSPEINSNGKDYGPYYSPVDYFLPEQSRSKNLQTPKTNLINYLKPNTNILYSDYTALPQYNTDTLYDYNVNPEYPVEPDYTTPRPDYDVDPDWPVDPVIPTARPDYDINPDYPVSPDFPTPKPDYLPPDYADYGVPQEADCYSPPVVVNPCNPCQTYDPCCYNQCITPCVPGILS